MSGEDPYHMVGLGPGEHACPNCRMVTPTADMTPIAIGTVVRYAARQERGLKATIASGGAGAVVEASEAGHNGLFDDVADEISDLPPVLRRLRGSLAELRARPALLAKTTRICGTCYSQFADTKEVDRANTVAYDRDAAQQAGGSGGGALGAGSPPKPPRTAAAKISSRRRVQNAAAKWHVGSRGADRGSDFAFTSLQQHLRRQANVRTQKAKIRHSFVAGAHAADIDWDTIPMTSKVAREVKHDAAAVAASPPRLALTDREAPAEHAETALVLHGASSESVGYPSPTRDHSAGATHLDVDEGAVMAELLCEADAPGCTSFDVPMSDTLSYELWRAVVAATEFGTAGHAPVPKHHALHGLYSRPEPGLRFQEPPHTALRLPTAASLAPFAPPAGALAGPTLGAGVEPATVLMHVSSVVGDLSHGELGVLAESLGVDVASFDLTKEEQAYVKATKLAHRYDDDDDPGTTPGSGSSVGGSSGSDGDGGEEEDDLGSFIGEDEPVDDDESDGIDEMKRRNAGQQ